jgi:hypothetical protein
MNRLLVLAISITATLAFALPPTQGTTTATDAGPIHAARLLYGGDQATDCFADTFLRVAAEQTHLNPAPTLVPVRADAVKFFEHPFVVMAGREAFSLTQDEANHLRRYLDAGGFLVASANCSSPLWNRSFAAALAQIDPAAPDQLEPLPDDHPVYRLIYDITDASPAGRPELRGLTRGGRLALVWSPQGLSDSHALEGECCCCGAPEVPSARQLNVNLLAFALTQ